MGFPFCYSLRISEYLLHLLLHPKMIELIRSSKFVSEEVVVVLKLIRRDIFIRFNSLTFAWTALSCFRSTGKPFFSQVALSGFQLSGCIDFFLFIPNFFLNRPFGFSIHCDALFLPKSPFRVFHLPGHLCVVSFDYVCIRRVRQVVAVHGGQDHCPTRKDVVDHKWSFVSRSPLAPGITVRKDDPLDYKISDLIYLTSDFLVESLDHLFLIRLTLENSS